MGKRPDDFGVWVCTSCAETILGERAEPPLDHIHGSSDCLSAGLMFEMPMDSLPRRPLSTTEAEEIADSEADLAPRFGVEDVADPDVPETIRDAGEELGTPLVLSLMGSEADGKIALCYAESVDGWVVVARPQGDHAVADPEEFAATWLENQYSPLPVIEM